MKRVALAAAIMWLVLLSFVLVSEFRPKSPAQITPGSSFRDCPACPEMIVVPAGSFTMGSPDSEEGRSNDEGPQHKVSVRSFAFGKYEVTFEQWDACVAAGGCTHKPNDKGWGRSDRPVINVSWKDAQQYVRWLSRITGKPYRLPNEAEWEYAARAGTTTRYHWGDIGRVSAPRAGTPRPSRF